MFEKASWILCSMSNATEISSHQTNFRNDSEFNVSCSLVNRTTAEICQAIACSFIFLTAILGNTMVVIVVYKERRMRTTVNFLIVNMALSDFLCSMLVIPRILTQLYTYPDACRLSRLSVRVKSSCEWCVYTRKGKRRIYCHILSKGWDVQLQRAIRAIYTFIAELEKTCCTK